MCLLTSLRRLRQPLACSVLGKKKGRPGTSSTLESEQKGSLGFVVSPRFQLLSFLVIALNIAMLLREGTTTYGVGLRPEEISCS